MKTVVLPDTIDYMQSGTFQDSSIESVNIPKSLRVIPDSTFKNCTRLKEVAFHENLLCIANTAFEGTDFDIPDNIAENIISRQGCANSYEQFRLDYGDYGVWIGADNSEGYYVTISEYHPSADTVNLILPDSFYGIPVKKIGCNFTGIESIEFPAHLTDLSGSFDDSLKSVKINENSYSLKIWTDEFKDCTSLEEIIFPQDCNITLGTGSFQNCISLEKITFPENCDITLENNVFRNCTSLKKIDVPNTCFITIGANAFENTGFQNLDINADCSIGKYAFRKLTSIESANFDGNAEVSAYAFGQCENLKEVSIAGQATLNNNAFYNCTSLENINIDTSQPIEGGAFNGCTSLMTINGEQIFDSVTNDLNPKYKDFIMENFKTADDVGFLNLYITEQMKKIVSENTTDDMTDIQKVKALHDWVCNNTVYNSGNEEVARTYNDAAILLNDATICEGYARTLNLLLNAAGLESYYVHSTTHAWNIVKLGGHYFHVDSTWDDGDSISYNYFLKSDSEISAETKSHAKWTLFQPSSLHSFQSTVLPECTYQMGDMNTDENVSIADLVLMNRYILGAVELSADDYILSDLNFDGRTDVFDMVKMRKLLTEQ